MSTQMDRLLAAQEKTQEKVRRAQEEEKQLKKRIAELKRNERTHRLCTRGGYVEKLLAELGAPELSDEEVYGHLQYLERAERPERIDLRSYARQGKDEAPTIHLGLAVSHLEQKGIQTEIGNYNRAIKEHNRLLKRVKELLFSVGKWLKEKKAALQKLTEPEKPQPTCRANVGSISSKRNMRKRTRMKSRLISRQ